MSVQFPHAISYPDGEVVWTLYVVGGDSFQLPVKSWEINRDRISGLTWNISLPLSADYRPGGEVGQYLRPEPYDDAWALRRYLICTITVAGLGVYESPKLVLLKRRFSIKSKDRTFICSGTDRSEALREDDVVHDDVRSEEGNLILASTVMAESLAAQGVTETDFQFTDFYIKFFHRTGSVAGFLATLFETFQGGAEWVGDTYTVRSGGLVPGELSADYTLSDQDADILVLEYQDAAAECINEATVERVGELKAGTTEPILGKGLGIITIPLSTPANYAVLRITLYGPGYTGEWTWDDEDSVPITMAPTLVFMNSTKAHQVRFNLYPPEESGPFPDDISYKVEIVIDEHITDIGDYSEDYSATYVNAADQALRGRKKLPQPITMGHIPSQAVAAMAAELKVKEDALNYQTAEIESTLNPTVSPWQIGAITAEEVGLTDHNMVTQSVKFSGDEKQMLMVVGLGRGVV